VGKKMLCGVDAIREKIPISLDTSNCAEFPTVTEEGPTWSTTVVHLDDKRGNRKLDSHCAASVELRGVLRSRRRITGYSQTHLGLREIGGIRTPGTVCGCVGFSGRCLKPLGHLWTTAISTS
jgi:hypothetical protein